jgi:GT2 family glycosyltransferase
MGRISIIVITWDSARYLPRCAEGVRSQTADDLELVVVDNASADASLELAASLLEPDATIANDTNRGFAAAANQGIARATGEWVVLLNPDVFMSPGYVESAVRALSEGGEEYGAATGKLLRGAGDAIVPTRTIDSKGIRMTRSGRHLDIGAGEEDVEAETAPREVFGVSGAAAVYRRAMLDDVALEGRPFDEAFFAYREDADLAWRARLFGWRSLYVPEAVAWHVRRVTPERRSDLPPEINMHSVKNRFLLRLKNEALGVALHNFPFELLRDAAVAGAALTVERSSRPALGWLWKNRREVMRQRREIQRRRRVPEKEIAKWFE